MEVDREGRLIARHSFPFLRTKYVQVIVGLNGKHWLVTTVQRAK